MTLTISIPEALEEALRRNVGGDLDAYVREVLAVDLYRTRKLTHGQLQKFLGVSSHQADAVLKKHGGVDDVSAEELEQQVETSQRLRDKRSS